jgi:SAM-dependent methyltransferase
VDLKELQQSWDRLGEVDPLWAILFVPARKGNKWDVGEFFASGAADLATALTDVEDVAGPLVRGRALDFGCGVGRITQPLADHFSEVDGVDIAPSMIKLAGEFNRQGDRCRYHVNSGDDLRRFPDATFDFVYCVLVLQHIERRYVERYLAEFLRVLKPGGILLFTLPSHTSTTPLGRIYATVPAPILNLYRRVRYGYGGVMELHGIPREETIELLEARGGMVVDIKPDPLVGTSWHSYRYCIRRAQI